MNPVKVAGVCDWPTLCNCIDMQALKKLINFYYRFFCGFLDIACLLFNITGNNITWTWEQEYTFVILKTAITSTLVLAFPYTFIPCKVKADILDFATGTVLSQQFKENNK